MTNESEKFDADLQDTMNKVSTDDMIIIMGYLNARVGQNQQQQIVKSSVKPVTVDVGNENGTRLVDFCEINNVIISNTLFKPKLVHQTSWVHPRNKVGHIIDYTLVNKKFRSSVEDVPICRRAAGAKGTDHYLMRVRVRLHLQRRRKNVNPKSVNVDSTKLKDDKRLQPFPKDLYGIIDDAMDNTIAIHVRYELFL